VWWWLIIAAAVATGWIEPYQIAFLSPTPSPVSLVVVLQFILLALFCLDIVLSFFVGYYDDKVGFTGRQSGRHSPRAARRGRRGPGAGSGRSCSPGRGPGAAPAPPQTPPLLPSHRSRVGWWSTAAQLPATTWPFAFGGTC
jgi:hypothetical protein